MRVTNSSRIARASLVLVALVVSNTFSWWMASQVSIAESEFENGYSKLVALEGVVLGASDDESREVSIRLLCGSALRQLEVARGRAFGSWVESKILDSDSLKSRAYKGVNEGEIKRVLEGDEE